MNNLLKFMLVTICAAITAFVINEYTATKKKDPRANCNKPGWVCIPRIPELDGR